MNVNFFELLRRASQEVAEAHCEINRLELNVPSATVLKAGPGRKFFVRYQTMTPSGYLQYIFVEVAEDTTNGTMVARLPFCNKSARFALKVFCERWNAPRPPSQQDVAEAAIWANHCKALGLSPEQMEEHLDTVRKQLFFQNE